MVGIELEGERVGKMLKNYYMVNVFNNMKEIE